ncbi:MAG: hypothetical protein QM771_10785 [Nitrospira sp.]
MTPHHVSRVQAAWRGLWGWAAFSLLLATGWVIPAPAGGEDGTAQVSEDPPTGEVQDRGMPKAPQFKNPAERKGMPQSSPPGGSPPAQLCHTETLMMTQCKCFNQADCQALTALFPNSCPAGSQHCEFVPLSRGPMPPLPPNLCGYQIPLPVTECSCHSLGECQLLSPYCPGSCPPGSQTCTCRPLRRG